MPSQFNFTSRYRFLHGLLLVGFSAALPLPAHATGDYYNSLYLLENPAVAALSAPEFWFELEMKDLAKRYEVKERHVPSLEEREQAIPNPDSPAKAVPEPPPDTPEMDLYEDGALAYIQQKYDDARAAWKKLLAMPEAERKARSVWAEYMLGRTAIAEKRPEEAPAHFQAARKLAAAGFQDEQGLAAASYGWEAFVWKASAPAKAIELYLHQLATGDLRAVTSIRFLLPTVEHYEEPDAEPPRTAIPAPPEADPWANAADEPLLRQVLTRWHLAYGADAATRYSNPEATADSAGLTWLKQLEKRQPKVEEADRLAWLAYREGVYDQAQRWLKMVVQETGLSAWLKAKLALRAGDGAAAEQAMAKAAALMEKNGPLEMHQAFNALPYPSVLADQAVVLMHSNHFQAALTLFLRAGHWQDAAYVAERVLTLKELKEYVDQNFPNPADPPKEGEDRTSWYEAAEGLAYMKVSFEAPKVQQVLASDLRAWLARRMVREDQEAAARPYFTTPIQEVLDKYLAALKRAGDAKSPAAARARGWWDAAMLAATHGDDLFRTAGAPDGVEHWAAVHKLRRTGKTPEYTRPDDSRDVTLAATNAKPIHFSLAPSAEEKKRLAKHVLPYEYPRHHLWIAAALAKKAAALLPAGSEEKADVLNSAGSWMFDRDEKREEEFFFAIKASCAQTEIGKQVLEKKHTFYLSGPWSAELEEIGY